MENFHHRNGPDGERVAILFSSRNWLEKRLLLLTAHRLGRNPFFIKELVGNCPRKFHLGHRFVAILFSSRNWLESIKAGEGIEAGESQSFFHQGIGWKASRPVRASRPVSRNPFFIKELVGKSSPGSPIRCITSQSFFHQGIGWKTRPLTTQISTSRRNPFFIKELVGKRATIIGFLTAKSRNPFFIKELVGNQLLLLVSKIIKSRNPFFIKELVGNQQKRKAWLRSEVAILFSSRNWLENEDMTTEEADRVSQSFFHQGIGWKFWRRISLRRGALSQSFFHQGIGWKLELSKAALCLEVAILFSSRNWLERVDRAAAGLLMAVAILFSSRNWLENGVA